MIARRARWALLLAAVVFLGTLDFHPAGEPLHESLFSAGAGEGYSASARHPGQPAHFEASQEAQRPVCPVCLHQMRTGGVRLILAAHVTAPVLAGFCAPLPTPLARERCAAPRGARGPPAA